MSSRVDHWTARIGGRELRARVSVDGAGRPVDVHASWGAPGNSLGVCVEAVCAVASVSLRAGVPLRGITRGWVGQRFEPSGETGDPLVPKCHSIVDYLARALEARFPAEYASEVA